MKTTSSTIATIVRASLSIAATVAVLGVAWFEAVAVRQQRTELASLHDQAGRLETISTALRVQHESVARRLRAARTSPAAVESSAVMDREIETSANAWLARVKRLRELVAGNSAHHPEFEFLTENDWFSAAKDAKLETTQQMGEAVLNLLNVARSNLARLFHAALARYADAHDGLLPSDPAQLAPFLDRNVSAPVFARYEMLQHGALSEVPAAEWILAERAEFARTCDSQVFVTAREHGTEDITVISDRVLRQAVRRFTEANQGNLPATPAQLVGYFKTPPTAPALKTFLEKPASDFAPEKLQQLLRPD